jgi:GAF domain-containing protein
MSDPPLFKSTRKPEVLLTSDQMVVNILTITTVSLIVIAAAVGIVGSSPITAAVMAISALITAGAILPARYGNTTLGRVLVPGLLTLVAAFIAYTRGGLYHISVSGFPVIIVLAGLLLGVRGSFLFALLTSIAAAFIGYADINGFTPFPAAKQLGYDDIVVAIVLFFTTAGVLRMIIRRLTDSLREAEANAQTQEEVNLELQQLQKELETRVGQRTAELQDRATQFQTIAKVSQTIGGIQNLDELLSRVTELISERFNIYHTGIFLVDERGENAVLQAANSAGGKRMLERGHHLKVGSQSMVGYVTSTGNPRIAADVGEDAVFFDNPDLPDTHSEITLSLRVSDQTFGALDLQSTQTNAFSNDDIQTLSILADQVAIAVQNARSFEQSHQAIQEVEAAYRQMTGQAWQRVTSQKEVVGYEYDGALPKPITKIANDELSLNIPLLLRGQSIGKFKLIAPEPNRKWTEDELAIAKAAAERTALTLETARLLEESQRRATREHMISEITNKISSITNIDSIMRSTVEELGKQIGGAEVTFELSTDSQESQEQK